MLSDYVYSTPRRWRTLPYSPTRPVGCTCVEPNDPNCELGASRESVNEEVASWFRRRDLAVSITRLR